MTYQPILQVRDSDGNLIDILTIRGKSAWDLAKEAGYSGTAQNLSEALSLISGGFYWEWQNGTNLGPSAVLHFGENSYNIGAIPNASASQSGIITNTTQIFAGTKSFYNDIILTKPNLDTSYVQLLFRPNYFTDNTNTATAQNTNAFIRVYDDGDNSNYGSVMTIQSGGCIIIGAGESPTAFYNNHFINNGNNLVNESLFVTADSSINFYTNCNTIENKKFAMSINTAGYVTTHTNSAGFKVSSEDGSYSLGLHMGSSGQNRGLYDFTANNWIIYRDADNKTWFSSRLATAGTSTSYWNSYQGAALAITTCDKLYRPLICTRTPTGGAWTLVNYNSENLLLVYTDSEQCGGTDDNSTSGSNDLGTRKQITFSSDGGLTLPGALNVSGVLTVNNPIYVPGDNRGVYVKSTDGKQQLGLHMGGGTNRGLYDSGSSGLGGAWALYLNDDNNMLINPATTFRPVNNDAVSCGSTNRRWSNIYAITETIGTSDRTFKDNINRLTEAYENLFMKLSPVSFTFKDGTSGRTHVGFISQDIEEAMEELNMSSLDFAGFCKDVKMKDTEDGSKEVIDYDENGNIQYIYSLRYGEFIAINTHMIQKNINKINQLTVQNQQLENTISELKTQIELLKLAIGG